MNEINFDLKTRLFALKQSGTFEKFLCELQLLINMITGLTGEQKLDFFMRSIRDDLRVQLKLKKVITLAEAIRAATTIEKVQNNFNKSDLILYA